MTDKVLEKVVEAPAVALEKTIEASRKLNMALGSDIPIKKARDYWHNLGPGLTTGAADDDPSGIATYSQTGAQYGFQLLWLAVFTLPFMAIVQEMCARIGLVTGRGLASNIRHLYPKWVLYLCTSLLFIANTLNLGADIGAMAKATQLLIKFPFAYLVIFFGVVTLAVQIFTTYEHFARYLKFLALVLVSYIITAMVINMNWAEVARHAVIPSITFSKEQLFLICGVLGTTISPYLFFWQTSQEVEEEILLGKTTEALRRRETKPGDIKNMRIDVWSGMFVSNLAMFFIIATVAATLFASGVTNIATAADAASALKPLAGDYAYLLFTIGIIGTGVLAVPVLSGSASYALAESFGWKSGLYKKLSGAYAFYGVIIISTLIGLAINILGWDPIKALIYSAVLNGLVAPVVLILIVLIGSNKKVMGEWVNKPLTTFFGWTITLFMIIAGLAVIYSMLTP